MKDYLSEVKDNFIGIFWFTIIVIILVYLFQAWMGSGLNKYIPFVGESKFDYESGLPEDYQPDYGFIKLGN